MVLHRLLAEFRNVHNLVFWVYLSHTNFEWSDACCFGKPRERATTFMCNTLPRHQRIKLKPVIKNLNWFLKNQSNRTSLLSVQPVVCLLPVQPMVCLLPVQPDESNRSSPTGPVYFQPHHQVASNTNMTVLVSETVQNMFQRSYSCL